MVGSKVEHAGIIRHGAKMLHVMSAATVPKITVVVRKAYGAGYYVMCGRAYEPDLIVSWPTGEISVMGAEGMVGIAARKLFGDVEPPPEAKKSIVEMIQKNIDIYKVAGWGLVDDVIDPRDTRRVLAWGLELAAPQDGGAARAEARRDSRLAGCRRRSRIAKAPRRQGDCRRIFGKFTWRLGALAIHALGRGLVQQPAGARANRFGAPVAGVGSEALASRALPAGWGEPGVVWGRGPPPPDPRGRYATGSGCGCAVC